jgi:hypothetical protein
VVVALALVAACANALASILQRLGVESAPSSGGADVMAHALRRPVWIAGFVVMAGGFAAQATALHFGALATVQPILVVELPLIVLALWGWFGVAARPRDGVAAIAAAGGLAMFLVIAAPVSGTRHPSMNSWLAVAGVIGASMVILLTAARNRPPWARALLMGAAASVGFALTAALTKAMTDALTIGWSTLFGTWPLYALTFVGLGSFVLMQRAFRAGPFAASQSTLILVNPFVSIVVGAVLFNDRLTTSSAALALEVPALIVMVAGAVALCTAPLVRGVRDEQEGTSWLAGRRRWRSTSL